MQNHETNFDQSWHEAFFGDGDSSFFKWRALSSSKREYPKHRKYIDKI